jgi:hypothetical protein
LHGCFLSNYLILVRVIDKNILVMQKAQVSRE